MNRNHVKTATALMLGVSTVALASPASADVLFSTSKINVEDGQRVSQAQGLTQVKLANGGTASFVDAADFRVNGDGTVDLYAGGVTVTGGSDGSETTVRMPEGVEGRVGGQGSSASFNVGPDGSARGHALSGSARVGVGPNLRRFDSGEMFAIERGSVRQVVANGAQSTPNGGSLRGDADSGPVVAMGEGAGPVAAAQNGLPVSLGDALAATGASGDILGAARRVEAAVANPLVETFPSGDLALLVAAAANLEGAFGGTPFPQAQADVIRAYLGFLAGGGSGADFLTAYSGFLVQYFDLIRTGGVPSGFALANIQDVNAFTNFLARTQGFAALSAQDQVLAQAYLEFIANGGNADLFAGTFTDLTEAYFAFLRAGGNPQDFADASLATVEDYIAFLDASGLSVQLSATDRALLSAYVANGGFAFVTQYQTALNDYFAFLASGQRPSEFTGEDIGVLLGYIQTLQAAGLLNSTLGGNAQFFADYAAFVQGGGQVDAFDQLNANIFAGYADALNAYFAFLDAGGVPSAYSAADVDVLNGFLVQLAAAGALDRFLGDNSAFFADYLAFLQGGGAIDTYAQLNANIFAGYADALAAYFAYLENGGIPSAYTELDQATIQAYLQALARVGATDSFLAELAAFYTDYFAFVSGGGNPDNFAGLPVPPDFPAFASALNAYAAFLSGGGLPSDYAAVDLALLQNYLEAIVASGQLADLLGANADLLTGYFTFLASGGTVDGFSGLPIYADYVTALNAYFAFLQGGGLPADYTALDQATLEAYLAALNGAGGFAAYGTLNAFFVDYFAFVSGGGDPAQFSGLPIYADYVAALNAYFAFLANGGLPSEYTVLDQATLEAYLAALASVQGGFGSFGTLNTFFADYFAFVNGGGDPDQFAGLPVNSGVPVRLTGYTGGFDPAVANINIIIGGVLRGGNFSGGESGFTTDNFSLDANGGLTSYVRQPGGQNRTSGSTSTTDIFGNSDVLIGRWTEGSFSNGNTFTFNANQGLHYMLARQPTTPFVAPTSGRIDYYLTAATRPTIADGSLAPGVFDAHMAILFGTQALLGFEGDVTFDNGGSDLVYAFSTTGGVSDLEQSNVEIGFNQNGAFSAYIPGLVGNDCDPDLCGFGLFASFAGDGEDTVGATYQVYTGVAGGNVVGAAIFEAGPSRTGGGGSGSGGDSGGGTGGLAFLAGDGNAPAGTDGDQAAYVGAAGNGVGLADPIRVTEGVLLQADLNREQISLTPTADSESQSGGSEGVLGWSRINEVGGSSINTNGQGFALQPFENGYVHAVWGTPAINLPTSGLINYELVGWTTPTANASTDVTGATFAGDLALDFAELTVGLVGIVTLPGETYTFSTEGGISDPSLAISTDPNTGRGLIFTDRLATVDSSNNDVTRGTFVQGFLAGDGASHVGLTYEIGAASNNLITGSAAFRATGGATGGGTGGGTPPTTGFTGTRDNQVFYTFFNGSLATGFGGSADFVGGEVTTLESILGTTSSGTAEIVESGDLGNFSWARWTDGDVAVTGLGGPAPSLGANAGYHVMTGEATFAVPASGTVSYDLIATTSPTDNLGSTPGTLTGALAIAFGTTSRVGYNFNLAVGGRSWGVETNGGAADPGSSDIVLTSGSAGFTFGGSFTSTSGTVNATGDACVVSCFVNVSGALYGNQGEHAGVAVNVTDTGSGAGTVQASGLAIFSTTAPASSVVTGHPSMAIAPTRSPIPVGGSTPPPPAPAPTATWDRWTVPAGVANAVEMPTVEAVPGQPTGTVNSSQPLGDWITFGGKQAH